MGIANAPSRAEEATSVLKLEESRQKPRCRTPTCLNSPCSMHPDVSYPFFDGILRLLVMSSQKSMTIKETHGSVDVARHPILHDFRLIVPA